jgi:hypothetical protein
VRWPSSLLAVCLAGSEGHPVAQPGGPGVCARPVRGEHRERGASRPAWFSEGHRDGAPERQADPAKRHEKTTHYSKD